jgi:hypothetical protein
MKSDKKKLKQKTINNKDNPIKKIDEEDKNSNPNIINLTIEKIDVLKNEIFLDIKKINNFNVIIKNYIQILNSSTSDLSLNKTNKLSKNIDQIFDIIKEIFYFFIGKIENISLDLLKFLYEKLNLLENLQLDLLDPEDQKKILSKNFLKIFEIFEIKNFLFAKKTSENNFNKNINNYVLKSGINSNVYLMIIKKFFLNKELIEAENIKLVAELMSNKLDLTHLFLIMKLLSEKFSKINSKENFESLSDTGSVSDSQSESDQEKISDKGFSYLKNNKKLDFLYFNLYNFIISLPKFTEFKIKLKKNKNENSQIEKKEKEIFLLKNPEKFDKENEVNVNNYEFNNNSNNDTEITKEDILLFYFEKNLQKFYERIIIKLINCEDLPEEILSNLLKNLNKIVLENLENPLIFSDFLINIYEKSKEKDFSMKVLSLSGLFVLITKYKLDYQNYYNMLYKSLCESYYDGNKLNFIFDSKYRNRIFKIFEISLKPSSVPILIILSFIKVIYLI